MSFSASHRLSAPLSTVWDWHTRPGAVHRLTPPFLPMRPRQEAASLRDGTTIFTLPAGAEWVARHDPTGYAEGTHFTDVCVNPPLADLVTWTHTHAFAGTGDDAIITDTVRTRAPSSTLRSTFAYRQHQLTQDLAFLQRLEPYGPQSLTVAMTGSSGLVGRSLRAQLATAGHRVIPLVRGTARGSQRHWNPLAPAPDLLDNVDVLVHLAGESLFGRFSPAHKQRVYESRIEPTRRLAELADRSAQTSTLVTASAIGYYGADCGDTVLREDSPRGDGFLADVVADWEAAALSATSTRVVTVRTGIALAGDGGMLPILAALLTTGLGGPIGDGHMWTSWIALDDLVDIYMHAILDPALTGPVNAVAPTPARNRALTSAIGRQVQRPTWVRIPRLAPALLLGNEGATELALANQRVDNAVLRERNHTYRYPDVDSALAHELGREELLENA